MTHKRDESICTIGPPRVSEASREVIAFHLHRYLSHWLARHDFARVLVSVGFEDSRLECVSYAISHQSARTIEVQWSFEDLCHAHLYGGGRLQFDCDGGQGGYETLGFAVVPVWDGETTSRRQLIAFALVDDSDSPQAAAEEQLAIQIGEALRAARRNTMRLFFDEKKHLPMKGFLYELLDHLPAWTGCDHSSALILTSNLDAMTLEQGGQARFGVLAERIYFCDSSTPCPRLVGMEIDVEQAGGLLAHAVEVQRRNPQRRCQVYRRSGANWFELGTEDEPLTHYHDVDERPEESALFLLPLMVGGLEDTEMLGFVSLSFRQASDLSESSWDLLHELGGKLSDVLRYSPLYMLSAHKMWILGQVRAALERTSSQSEVDTRAALEGYIGEVTRLIARQVDVPSMAIAYLTTSSSRDGGDESADLRRWVRYVHPHGWAHFDGLELAIDVRPEERPDSGVSALAMRLGRPLVLAGGYGQGQHQGFKNELWVDEQGARIIDGRSFNARHVLAQGTWVPLKAYYKPARASAYATLAYPVMFASRVLGVVTIEVERDTDWLWWTGFGGQLFWQWLAADLGYAFSALGV
jgi:hypothetical protein